MNTEKLPSLSLCMIVKNEEEFLEECLQSVQDIVSQIVIIDTGSTDSTLEIARKYNAEIHEFNWIDDFAAARNESIKFATGDWILWLDADERIISESKDALKKELIWEESPIAYKVSIQNVRDGGTNYFLSDADRLFRNHQGITFQGRIHEQITYSLQKLNGKVKDSKLKIYHLGYGFEPAEAAKKYARNEKLLLKLVKEEPNNAYAHYTLGQNYGLQLQYQKAIHHYQIAINLKQFNPNMTVSLLNVTAENYLKVHRVNDAKKLVLKSVAMIPQQVAGYYLLFKVAETENDPVSQIRWLKKILESSAKISTEGKQLSADILIRNEIVYGLLAKKLSQNNQLAEALAAVNKLLVLDKENIEGLKVKADIQIRQSDFSAATETLNQLIRLAPTLDHLLLLGNLMIKMQQFDLAIRIFEQGRELDHGNELILKRLVGLYAKKGNMAKAEALLADLNKIS